MSELNEPVTVRVFNPDAPFGGVRVTLPDGGVKMVVFDSGSPVRSVFGRIGDILPLCTDYDECYAPLGTIGLPEGGLTGQVLTKIGDASFDADWATPTGLPTGGTTGQVLSKVSNTDFDADWTDPSETPLADPTATVGLTPVIGILGTAMRSDSAPALDQGIEPEWTALHIFDLAPKTEAIPVDPDELTNKSYVDSLTAPTGSRLLSGGGVSWDGTGFDFTIAAATYLINGVQFNSAETGVTLDASDPTDDRIDVFYVDVDGLAGVLTGTPGGPPVEPQVDPATQLRLTSVIIEAASTDPGITLENIYLENTEWTTAVSGGTINADSTNNPFAGTKCVEGTNTASGNYVQFTKPSGTLSLQDFPTITLELRSKATWPNPKSLNLQFTDATGPFVNVGVPVTIKQGTFGFDSSITSVYQLIVIPTSLFSTGNNPINRLRITVAGGGGNIGWYIDNVILQSGGGGGGTPGGDFSTNTNTAVVNEIVLFADTTGKLGKRATGTGVAKLTSGVLGTASAGTDYESPLTFSDSLNRNVNTVNLDNDSDTPGNSMLYGTNGAGVKGWYAQPAVSVIRNFTFGASDTGGLSTGKLNGFWTCPFDGTITGWNITVDAGTLTVKIWKIATGTAKPTVANSINTSGIGISTGTAVRSSVVTDFTTTAVTAGDIFAVEITAASGVTELGGAVEITQT